MIKSSCFHTLPLTLWFYPKIRHNCQHRKGPSMIFRTTTLYINEFIFQHFFSTTKILQIMLVQTHWTPLTTDHRSGQTTYARNVGPRVRPVFDHYVRCIMWCTLISGSFNQRSINIIHRHLCKKTDASSSCMWMNFDGFIDCPEKLMIDNINFFHFANFFTFFEPF